MNQPRGPITEGACFAMNELVGKRLELAVQYRCDPNSDDGSNILAMLFSGTELWHRFYLDLGLGFWEEWAAEDVFDGFENCQRVDLSARWQLKGRRVVEARCIGDSDSAERSEFRWRFDCGELAYGFLGESCNEEVVAFDRSVNKRMKTDE